MFLVRRLKRSCPIYGCFMCNLWVVVVFLIWKNWKQTKKLTARSEKEATEADLMAAKMQVEATDAAEETKKRLDKSM
jgi:hypothetical protein